MSIKEWTKALTEDGLTVGLDGNFIPCRAELISPQSDWENIWRLCRLEGIDSVLAPFNFKLLHGLLITKKGLQRLSIESLSSCNLCSQDTEDTLEHSIIDCNFNNGIGATALQIARVFSPDVSPEALLRLEFSDVSEELELSLVTFTSTIFHVIWEKRFCSVKPTLFEVRCQLEARCQILRETRFSTSVDQLSDMIRMLQ